jgi:hypothetical protein
MKAPSNLFSCIELSDYEVLDSKSEARLAAGLGFHYFCCQDVDHAQALVAKEINIIFNAPYSDRHVFRGRSFFLERTASSTPAGIFQELQTAGPTG